MNTKPETKTNEYLKGIVSNLPEKPGVYQYLNTEGTIIYVGKAKNLKKRVYSYFSKEHEPGKTRVLVSKIADIRYIVVNTEEDALLLENNLIKKYKPRYNVLLKDDKTYPSICVQNEYFPRVFRTRKIIRNGSSYYGPYSHIPSMYALLDLIKHLYPLRTCTLNLSPENIRAGKFKVCLEYHIKKCAGPCIGLQSQEDYLKNIDEIKVVTSGAGAAGIAIIKLLISMGLKNVIMCDRKGAIYKGREGLNKEKEEMAEISNQNMEKGSLADVIKGADVFIGVSAPGTVTQEMIHTMAPNPVLFPMANPTPEIMPEEAKAAGAAVIGTGRSDFPNQINNVLAFPGIFRGALDVRASDINDEMKVAAAYAIANIITDEERNAEYIIPNPFDKRLA